MLVMNWPSSCRLGDLYLHLCRLTKMFSVWMYVATSFAHLLRLLLRRVSALAAAESVGELDWHTGAHRGKERDDVPGHDPIVNRPVSSDRWTKSLSKCFRGDGQGGVKTVEGPCPDFINQSNFAWYA